MVANKGLEEAIAYLNLGIPSEGHEGNPSHQLWVRVECTLCVYLLVQLIPLCGALQRVQTSVTFKIEF